jgi:hypothetical protein
VISDILIAVFIKHAKLIKKSIQLPVVRLDVGTAFIGPAVHTVFINQFIVGNPVISRLGIISRPAHRLSSTRTFISRQTVVFVWSMVQARNISGNPPDLGHAGGGEKSKYYFTAVIDVAKI